MTEADPENVRISCFNCGKIIEGISLDIIHPYSKKKISLCGTNCYIKLLKELRLYNKVKRDSCRRFLKVQRETQKVLTSRIGGEVPKP